MTDPQHVYSSKVAYEPVDTCTTAMHISIPLQMGQFSPNKMIEYGTVSYKYLHLATMILANNVILVRVSA